MKKFTLLLSTIIFSFFVSCNSSDDSNDIESVRPIACFTLSNDEVIVGEEIIVTNCSQNATNIKFSYSNEQNEITITESEFSLEFSTAGEYLITLEVSNEKGETNKTNKTITVLSVDRNFKYFDYPIGVEGIPSGFGMNQDTKTFYFLEFNRDFSTNNSKRQILYKELTESYSIKNTFFIHNVQNSLFFRHCIKVESSKNQHVFIPLLRFPSPYSSPIYTLDQNGNLISKEESSLDITHGKLEFNGNQAYYGGIQESVGGDTSTTPSIQIRNNDHVVIQTLQYDIGSKSAFIGDLIKSSTGYIGFGGSFNGGNDLFDYTPIVYFFNTNLELIKHKEFSDTSLTMEALQLFAMGTWFHIEELNSGNLVLYGLNEMIITDSNGDKINSQFFKGTLYPSQGLVNLGDSFIISTKDFLRKFDSSGNEIKNVFFDGDITPNFILNNEKIFFVSGNYKKETVENNTSLNLSKIFMGAIDKDLKFINFNN